MRIDVRPVAGLTAEEQAALRALSAAVYPPDVAASWPGRVFEWAPHQWSVICWDDDGQALSHAGAVVRDGRADGTPARIGGVGGVKTHPGARRRGLASQVIRRAMDLFGGQGVDFALLVCEPHLVPFYERLGWKPHAGDLLVRQHGEAVRFTFNLPMTHPVRTSCPPGVVIDLMCPPW
jgi:GNAT superfamily N-acetyltransferase